MNLRHLLLVTAAASQFAAAAQPETRAVEFFNPALRHYFITADANEASGIDQGRAGAGWTRTGRSFGAWLNPANAPAGSAAVCRFYSIGANSHFFTADAAECASLKSLETSQRQVAIQLGQPFSGWAFEGIAFTAAIPAGTAAQTSGRACPAGTEDIFRAYNNGFVTGEGANHRFVNDAALRDLMIDRGWNNEGVAFCAPVGDSGTSAPSTPSTSGFPELAATWTGPSNWEARILPGGARTETQTSLSVTITDTGALTGNGNGCVLSGAVSQVDGFRVFYIGTIGAAGCANTAFNGSSPLRIERLGASQLQLHFGRESTGAEVEVEAFLGAATTPPPPPPPPPAPPPPPTPGFVLAGTWGASDAQWTVTTRQGNNPEQSVTGTHALSMTISTANAVTGSGFGCSFTGSIQQPNSSVAVFVASLQASGCADAAFNGSYSNAGLHTSDEGALELEVERESETGGVKTKVHVNARLRK